MAVCQHQIVGRDGSGRYYMRPCGQCLQCRINDTRAWFVRSHFELKKLERPFHYFLTLTYNDESIPENGLCQRPHLKNFLNHLNVAYKLGLRYFATSDYGSINNRCHYHAIMLSTKKITQSMCEKIWKKGFVYLKNANKDNLKYVLRYTVKKKPMDTSQPGWFRLISKGWGNNVAQYYTGQDFFEIDGRKYGINSYLRQKLGLQSIDNFKSKYYENIVRHSSFKNIDTWEKFVDGMNELNIKQRRLK